MGKKWKQWLTSFFWALNSLQIKTAAVALKNKTKQNKTLSPSKKSYEQPIDVLETGKCILTDSQIKLEDILEQRKAKREKVNIGETISNFCHILFPVN